MSIDLSFVFDERIKKILDRDYAELQRLDPRITLKSVIVLSGGIIEGLLFDALVASGKWSFEEACQSRLQDMVVQARNKNIITEDRLTDATRKYRNLIHPGREVKDGMIFEESDALVAKSAVDIFIREVRNWAGSEARRREIHKFLSQLNQDQSEFIRLFSTAKPTDPNQFDHPFLRHGVYSSTQSLVENGVLVRDKDETLGEHQERVTLNPEAIDLVEQLVIKGSAQRDSIVLDFSNIAASGAGGSGAPPNTFVRR
jgi:polyhydroxyalkanoate synthesis regulator phasin